LILFVNFSITELQLAFVHLLRVKGAPRYLTENIPREKLVMWTISCLAKSEAPITNTWDFWAFTYSPVALEKCRKPSMRVWMALQRIMRSSTKLRFRSLSFLHNRWYLTGFWMVSYAV